MAGVQRTTIRALKPDIKNSLVVGIIIHRSRMNSFAGKSTSYVGSTERGVWNFTLRDSESDFINVTAWGSKAYIEGLSSTFHIGHVVELINPKITLRQPGDRGEPFVPSVSSIHGISLNEGVSDMHTYNAPDRTRFVSLLALPTKNPKLLKPLSYVQKNLDQLKDTSVDLMLVVMSLGAVNKTASKKNGTEMVFRDVQLNDGSSEIGETLRLWESEWVERSEFWQPRHTVLFVADALILMNTFKKQYGLCIGRRTLITENPNIPRTQTVRAATRNLPESSSVAPVTTASSVTADSCHNATIMTIRQICEHVNSAGDSQSTTKLQFTPIVVAVIDQMNFDVNTAIVTSCGRCSRLVPAEETACRNEDCPSVRGTETSFVTISFNFRLHLSDSTGHLVGCRLVGKTAEEFVKCTAEQFKAMSATDRDFLKWQFIMERCKIGLHVTCTGNSQNPAIYNIRFIKQLEKTLEVAELSTPNEPLYS